MREKNKLNNKNTKTKNTGDRLISNVNSRKKKSNNEKRKKIAIINESDKIYKVYYKYYLLFVQFKTYLLRL